MKEPPSIITWGLGCETIRAKDVIAGNARFCKNAIKLFATLSY
jgi:hypothetical protein